ncbi:MAG: L-lactate dehydrogenase [Lachnospiraceae bacterium]|nr:L-lactate dehydrogenase [Lachnospiraceae bacterium]
MNQKTTNKIVVVGAGKVGEAICYTLMLKIQVSEIVIIDVDEERAEGAAMDISHGTAYYSQVRIRQGGYEECADAAAIIVTAGIPRKPGQTRLDLAKVNTSVAKSVARNIMQYAENPLIIVVANPVDVNTYLIRKETGLPAGRVIGTGTSLDTARFRFLISELCHVDVRDVQGYILGEHGDAQVPIWSGVNVAGEPIENFLPMAPDHWEKIKSEIADKAKSGGADVISLKGATFEGIAMATLRIIEAIIKDQNTVLPVAHVLGEEYGEMADSCISLPCVINSEGISRALQLTMSKYEEQQMIQSALTLKRFIRSVCGEDEGSGEKKTKETKETKETKK